MFINFGNWYHAPSILRGGVPDSFEINPDNTSSEIEIESANLFLLWSLSHYSDNFHVSVHSTSDKQNIPSCTGTNSLLPSNHTNFIKTRIAPQLFHTLPQTLAQFVHI